MYNLYLVHQLTDAALDLLRIAGENETLQKLEDCHEILRDATPDDRLLAVRNLTGSLRLRLIRVIHDAYCAAPSEFPPEFAALLDEHSEFADVSLCYDGAPDESRCAEELRSKSEELRTADAEGVPHDARHTSKGLFSSKRTAPLEPQESARGKPLDLPLSASAVPILYALRKGILANFGIYSICFCVLLRLAASLIVNEAASLNGLDAFCP